MKTKPVSPVAASDVNDLDWLASLRDEFRLDFNPRSRPPYTLMNNDTGKAWMGYTLQQVLTAARKDLSSQPLTSKPKTGIKCSSKR